MCPQDESSSGSNEDADADGADGLSETKAGGRWKFICKNNMTKGNNMMEKMEKYGM